MTNRAAIILSGGKAERFQNSDKPWQDKALVNLFETPLLVHAIKNTQTQVEEIAVVVNDEKRRALYSKVLAKHHVKDVKLVIDEKIDHLGGPLVAIFTGLKSVEAEYCLTLPSDMPLLQPKVIEYLFDKARDSLVVVPMWPNGRLETLVMVLERTNALQIADTLCRLKRPRSDDLIRGTSSVLFASIVSEIKEIDPDLKSFININSPEDLTHLQPRWVQGSATGNIWLNSGSLPVMLLKRLREAATMWKGRKFQTASELFADCATQLEIEDRFFWAALSRENEGKSRLDCLQKRGITEFAEEEVAKVKKALLKSADNYGLEAELHEKNRLVYLAERARSDKLWCESRAVEVGCRQNSLG